tara:strand:- start:8267 stop:9115 length:849 start_codon:yes stop_codon:yes gene_type:complete
MTYYIKADKIQQVSEDTFIATINNVAVLVDITNLVDPASLADSSKGAPPDYVAQALVDIRLSTRTIAGWLDSGQPSNLGPSLPSGTVEPVDNSRQSEARTRQEPLVMPPPSIAPKSEPEKEVLFQVNEEATTRMDWPAWSKQLDNEYTNNPKSRRAVIKKVAGMVRLDMLMCKQYFSQPLRAAAVNNILRRDALNTGLVPPDLAAFIDDRPIAETLGSKGWDPGSDQAKDVVSPNWAASQIAQNNISNQAGEEEFAHMYASTEEMDIGAIASNAKNLFGSGS